MSHLLIYQPTVSDMILYVMKYINNKTHNHR